MTRGLGTIMGWVLATALAAAAMVPSAEARRFRFGLGGSGTSEKIERVADLPDRDPYRHEGEDWDLGWFYSGYKVAGITTSSGYDAGRFVLYSGRRYVLLDDEALAMITGDLGEDPTAAFRAERAAATAQSRAKAAAEAASLADNLIERRPGESIAAYHARARAEAGQRSAARAANPAPAARAGGMAGTSSANAIMGILLVFAFAVGVLKLVANRGLRAVFARGSSRSFDPGADSFDARVAARLRELDAAPIAAPVAVPAPVAPPPAPAAASFAPRPRTFGRRVSA